MPGPHTLRLLPLNLPFVGRGLDPSAPCLPCQREVAPQRRRDSCLLPTAFLYPPPVGAGHARPARFRKLLYPHSDNPCSHQPPRPHQLPPARNLPRPKNSPRGCFCPAVRWTRGPGFSIPAWVTFYARHLLKSAYKEKSTTSNEVVLFGDPCVHLPRTKKQSAGLFFAACGRPSCSIPRTEAPKNSPA